MMNAINNMMNNLSRNQLITLVVVLVIGMCASLYYLYKCIRSSEVEYFNDTPTNMEDREDFSIMMLQLECFTLNGVVIVKDLNQIL